MLLPLCRSSSILEAPVSRVGALTPAGLLFPIPPISLHHSRALPERNLRLTAIADMRPYRWATGLDRKAALESKYRATLLEFETAQAADEIFHRYAVAASCHSVVASAQRPALRVTTTGVVAVVIKECGAEPAPGRLPGASRRLSDFKS